MKDSYGYLFDVIERSKALKNINETIKNPQLEEIKEKALSLGVSLSEVATTEELLKKFSVADCKTKNINHRKKNKELKNWQHNKFWQKSS